MTTEQIHESATVQDIEFFAEDLDVAAAAEAYRRYGCLVVRGLTRAYVDAVGRDIEATFQESVALLSQASKLPFNGWSTPNGALFLPAPEGFVRDKQMMVLPINYHTSAAFLQSAMDPLTLDLVSAVLGPNIELFLDGQSLYKEPVGGHPKKLHQDSAYFEHRYEGPLAILNYVVETNLNNGALYVVPGSHKFGTLKHVDTFSHLGLDEDEWPWERALPITGGPGDGIFFHYRTIHGSQENYSDKPRPVFINRYRRPDDFVTVSAATVEAREEAEKHAAEARKQNQRGLMVRGFREYRPEE
jgi:ectoine hydroxylase-related dioxygenase (phytanoyl-CoA dioxygenase family)